MLYAFAALLIFQFLGELLVRALGLDLPGPLAGAMLLLAALAAYGRVPQALEQTSAALLQNLMLLFIPTVAGVMLHGEYLAAQWLPFVVTAIVTTALTLAVTVLVFKWAQGWFGNKSEETNAATSTKNSVLNTRASQPEAGAAATQNDKD